MRALLAFAAFAWLAAAPAALAQTPLFSADSEITLLVEGPLTSIVREAPRRTDAHPARVTISAPGAAPRSYDIALSPRGLSRRTRGFCAFPPLMLDFDKDELTGGLLAGQNRLKLVTHCRPTPAYEQLAVLEYVAYRLFNLTTPLSYRARPARVTYRDTEGRRAEETRFGFLIEDVDDLARRNRGAELDANAIEPAALDATSAARLALFQFMISNVDFGLTRGPPGEACCHNARLITLASGAVAPAAYDFDHSGLVDAPYATVPDSLNARSVRTRIYRGHCAHNDAIAPAIAHFRARRAAMNALLAAESRLTAARRAQAQAYLDEFFTLVEDPERVERMIIGRCRD